MFKKRKQVKESAEIGNINLEIPDYEIKIQGVVPIDYATAVNDRQRRIKKFKKDFEEKNKIQDEFVRQQEKRTVDVETTKEMQRMKLSESLFESNDTTKLYKRAENLADMLDKLLADIGSVENVSDFILDSDFDVLNKACEVLQDFAIQYSHVMDNENIFESSDNKFQNAEESVDTDASVVKKRSRGPNQKPEDRQPSDGDIFLQVYDELSAQSDDEGPKGDVHKNIKTRRGNRYSEIYVGPGDYDITIYGTKPEDFDFAKQVADYYKVHMDGPIEDTNSRTNGYYKYKAIFRNLK